MAWDWSAWEVLGRRIRRFSYDFSTCRQTGSKRECSIAFSLGEHRGGLHHRIWRLHDRSPEKWFKVFDFSSVERHTTLVRVCHRCLSTHSRILLVVRRSSTCIRWCVVIAFSMRNYCTFYLPSSFFFYLFLSFFFFFVTYLSSVLLPDS